MAISRQELISALERGEVGRLVGEFESEWLECKQTPYRLEDEAEKLELAKDVSALANSGGGVIVVGWRTEKDQVHREDRIVALSAFPADMFDPVRYTSLLDRWLWPPLSDLRIETLVAERETHRFAAIIVGPVAPENRPVLMTLSRLEDGTRTHLVFGYCERRRAAVAPFGIERIHSAVRDGLRFEALVSEGFESIRALVGAPASNHNAEPPTNLQKVISHSIQIAGLSDVPTFYLAARPKTALDLRGLFESKSHPLVQLLENPPEVRSGGFGIDAGSTSQIVGGELRRAVIPNDRLLQIHRDGIIIFCWRANAEGLSWAPRRPPGRPLRINQLALVEAVYLFALLAAKVYEHGSVTGRIELTIGLRRMVSGEGAATLRRGELDRYMLGEGRPAPVADFDASITVDGSTAPEQWAFALLERIYNWFSIESDGIPYARGSLIDRGALAAN